MPGAPGAGGAQRSRRPTGWRFPRPGRALAVRTRQNSPQANNWAGGTGGGCGRRVWPVPAADLQSVAPPVRRAHQLALYDMPGQSIRVFAARASYQRPCALHSSPHRLLCMGVAPQPSCSSLRAHSRFVASSQLSPCDPVMLRGSIAKGRGGALPTAAAAPATWSAASGQLCSRRTLVEDGPLPALPPGSLGCRPDNALLPQQKTGLATLRKSNLPG